jgi:hypothetical protein
MDTLLNTASLYWQIPLGLLLLVLAAFFYMVSGSDWQDAKICGKPARQKRS